MCLMENLSWLARIRWIVFKVLNALVNYFQHRQTRGMCLRSRLECYNQAKNERQRYICYWFIIRNLHGISRYQGSIHRRATVDDRFRSDVESCQLIVSLSNVDWFYPWWLHLITMKSNDTSMILSGQMCAAVESIPNAVQDGNKGLPLGCV